MKSGYPLGKLVQLMLLLYLGVLLFSWPVGALFGDRLDQYAGTSVFLQRLEGQPFDALFLAEFMPNAAPLQMVSPLVPSLVMGYFLFHVLFAGGAMFSLAERRGPFWGVFWQGFMKYGARFLLLNLGFLPVAAVLVALIVSLFQLVGGLAPDPAGDMVPVYLGLLQALVVFLAVSLLQTMHYVIRAQWVVRPLPLRRLLLVPLVRDARFLLGGAGRYLGITLLGFGLAAVMVRLAVGAREQGLLMVALLQLAILCTVAGRVWLYAAFVNHSRRRPLADPVPAAGDIAPASPGAGQSEAAAAETGRSPQTLTAGEQANHRPAADDPAAGSADSPADEHRPGRPAD